MTLRALRPITLAALLVAAAELPAQAPARRPLKHSDYEIWNTATGVTLSPDGKHVAYVLIPGEGDGAVVVRNVVSGAEQRIASGGKASEPAAEPAAEPTRTAGPAGAPTFTPDSKRLIVPLAPPRSAVEKAKAEKKKADEMPRGVLAVIDLSTGKVTDRIEKVRSFSVVGEQGAGVLIYHKEPKPEDQPKEPAKEQPKGPAAQPPGGRRQFPGGARQGATPQRPTVGTDLVVRDLASGSEVMIADVAEFSVTKDAKQLVYTVQSKAADHNGVYAAQLASPGSPLPLKSGPGRYTRLTWDEGEKKLAFFYAEPTQTGTPTPTAPAPKVIGDDEEQRPAAPPTPPPALPPAKVHVYVWERKAPPQIAARPMSAAAVSAVALTAASASPAVEVLGPTPPGLKAGWSIVDRGGLGFSADGLKLTVATAPAPSTDPTPTSPAGAVAGPAGRFGPAPRGDDKVDLDIWHWKDDYVQPMQKVRSTMERNRTFKGVFFLDTKQFRQVDDEDVTVNVPQRGDWALASSDKKYRAQNWLYPNPRDYALVNLRTGEGKPLVQAQEGTITHSPKGGHVIAFDGKDWHAITCPGGKRLNLTAKLPATFFDEEDDHPATHPAYGLTGWTPDEKFILLHDRYDIWKVAVDGSGAENLTKVGRGLKTRFRRVPERGDEDQGEPRSSLWVNLSKPMLLIAENLETRDTGFYRLEPGGRPTMLLMGARKYAVGYGPGAGVTKATKADVYMFTVSTFADYPDYYVADRDFKEVKRVTDINPRVREFNWGKAELIHYHSADGVPLSGVLIKPEDFDPAKKYPMMVYIYERLSQGLHNFNLPRAGTSINPTYYASNGYLVLMPDIVYTTGTPGQSALKCVLPAIQAVADKGFVNEAAIGIQGHSWGGYQIAYLVTQTNRFKAAAAGAPVSNMTSAYGGIRWSTGLPRQFQYEHSQSRIGKSLWEAPMRYIENSPLFHADKVQTPLLMLHNDQDGAVPWYQGIEYYMALRRLGKEVYLLNYNGEDHGLRKRSSTRDYTMRMQQFFDHHLKGVPAPEWMTKGVPYNERDKEKEQWKKLFEPEKVEKK